MIEPSPALIATIVRIEYGVAIPQGDGGDRAYVDDRVREVTAELVAEHFRRADSYPVRNLADDVRWWHG